MRAKSQIPFTGSPVFNAARTLPGFEAGRATVSSRDAVRVLEFFAKLPDSGTRNFAYTVLGGFYDMAGYEQRETDAFLADCANREQGSSTLSILYANRLIGRGWAVRGEKGARERFRVTSSPPSPSNSGAPKKCSGE